MELRKVSTNFAGFEGGVGGGSYFMLACAFAASIVTADICACCWAQDGLEADGTHTDLTRLGTTDWVNDI